VFVEFPSGNEVAIKASIAEKAPFSTVDGDTTTTSILMWPENCFIAAP
jgi:hypothetical protein